MICKSCKGTGVYQGLLAVEPCKECQGQPTPVFKGSFISAGPNTQNLHRLYLPELRWTADGFMLRYYQPSMDRELGIPKPADVDLGDEIRVSFVNLHQMWDGRQAGSGFTTYETLGSVKCWYAAAVVEGHDLAQLFLSRGAMQNLAKCCLAGDGLTHGSFQVNLEEVEVKNRKFIRLRFSNHSPVGLNHNPALYCIWKERYM